MIGGGIVADGLVRHVTPAVSSVSRQTPVFGNLPGSEGGDFVFEIKHEAGYLRASTRAAHPAQKGRAHGLVGVESLRPSLRLELLP
jgi:hypothetical protein